MEERIARVEDENRLAVKQLEEQRSVLRERVAEADKKIAEVQKKLDELNQAARRTGADLAVEVDRLREEVARLRGSSEESQHRIETVGLALEKLRSDLDGRFAALKGSGALEEYEAKRKIEALPRPADKAGLLAQAQEQERAGEKVVARELYEEYTRRYPADPRAADAWFRIGEMHYGSQRYREAVLAYGKVAEGFPRSDKVPDAKLRAGESMLALGLPDDARAIFEEVARQYPKTTAAQKARTRLVDMKKKSGKPAPKKK
ncbi:MAG: tetratricopeptide repeat protein [Deltaproteobacteria bacterium]|nr:tetratricopeptide repeat protein [Deltaproteobacteria bacterium]